MRQPLFAWVALLCASAGPALAQMHPTGVPALSSRPGAAYTIYLDFGGFSFTGMWINGATPGVTPAYDNASGAFTAQEQANIANIWARVAEKYAPFNINVTTVDPAVAAGQAGSDAARQTFYDKTAQFMHTVVGGTGSWYAAGGTGASGVRTDQSIYPTTDNGGAGDGFHTNFVFAGLGSSNLTMIGEVAAHENGHGLGLTHQVDVSSSGSLVSGYGSNYGASGYGSYAPIMGSSLGAQRGTWRVGTSDKSGWAIQNDVRTIMTNRNIGGFVNDGVGHSPDAATLLPLSAGGAVDPSLAKGVIVPASATNPTPIGVSNYVSDYFWFRTDGSTAVTLTAVDGGSLLTPGTAEPGATLRSTVRILDATSMNVVGTATLSGNTLSETFTGTLPPGRYVAEVASAGGYTSTTDSSAQYFDMGSYFLTGAGFSAAKWMAGASVGDWSVATNWLGQSVPLPTEDVAIPAGASAVHSTGSDTVRGLTIAGNLGVTGGTVTASSLSLNPGGSLTGPGNLQVTGPSIWSGGSMSGAGRTVVAAGASLTVTAIGGVTLTRTIDNMGTVTLAGRGDQALSGESTGAIINSGTFSVSGSGVATVQIPLANMGTLAVHSGGLSLTGGVTDGAVLTSAAGPPLGAVVVDAGASLAASYIRQASLTAAGVVSLRRAQDGGDTSFVGSLTLTGSGTLDVADNPLVIAGGGADVLRQYLQSGFNSGGWTGPGLTSSVVRGDSSGRLAIGYATAGQLGITTWGGLSGLAGDELVTRVTVYGDANLDGVIDADDFALTDRGRRLHLPGWVFGDFDYSGSVDSVDYWLLDRGYLLQSGGAASPGMLAEREAEFGAAYVAQLMASVPEPGGIVGAMLLLGELGARRRRGKER